GRQRPAGASLNYSGAQRIYRPSRTHCKRAKGAEFGKPFANIFGPATSEPTQSRSIWLANIVAKWREKHLSRCERERLLSVPHYRGMHEWRLKWLMYLSRGSSGPVGSARSPCPTSS